MLTRHDRVSCNDAKWVEGCHELSNLSAKCCPDLEQWNKYTGRHRQRGGDCYLEHLGGRDSFIFLTNN